MQFLQFVWISSNKPTQINIFHTLALKIVKQTLLNLTYWELSNNTMNALKFQYSFQFGFHLILIKKNGSIINSFHTS
jgi:hypothetical protein